MSETKPKRSAPYRTLDEIVSEHKDRVPLSTRVKSDTKKLLNSEAKKRNLKVSSVAAAILDDYANWYANSPKPKGIT